MKQRPTLKTGQFVIFAPSVNSGGGKVLLDSLLEDLPTDQKPICILNSDYCPSPRALTALNTMQVLRFGSSTITRLFAELKLRSLAQATDWVLCFGNFPPLFRLSCPVSVFFQNKNLLERRDPSSPALRTQLRHFVARAWLKLNKHHAANYIVQTASVARGLASVIGAECEIQTLAFVPSEFQEQQFSARLPVVDFVYIASGFRHKNHRNLVQAWRLLAGDGIFPSLCLTLDERVDRLLLEWVTEVTEKYGLKITNRAHLSRDQIWTLLSESRALVFPSRSESFGLPLLEADRLRIPILAPEADYVRDVVCPVETFDPESPTSIARAVRRFLKIKEDRLPLVTARQFAKELLGRNMGRLEET